MSFPPLEQLQQLSIQEPFHSQPDLEILGTTLEGGGQLVRLSICLAAILSRPIHLTHIRGNRQGKTGLKGSHLEALSFLCRVSGSDVRGEKVGSREIWFAPSLDRRSHSSGHVGARGEEYHQLRQHKPGSIFLIMQAVLPYVFWKSSGQSRVHLKITGGTNVPLAPSADYIIQVLIPVLHKIGISNLELQLIERGWTSGAISIGEVELRISPLVPGTKLPSFQLTNRSKITSFDITILAHPDYLQEIIRKKAVKSLKRAFKDVEDIQIVTEEDSHHHKRLYLLIVAKGENGERLGSDWLWDEKMDLGHAPGKKRSKDKSKEQRSQATRRLSPGEENINFEAIDHIAEKLVDRVVQDIQTEIQHGGYVDRHMADQLVVFQALAEGKSVVDLGEGQEEGTLHTQTVRWVAEQFVGRDIFDVGDRSTEGIGLRGGEDFRERSEG